MKEAALAGIWGSGDGGRNLVGEARSRKHISASFMLVNVEAPSPTYLRKSRG